MMNWIIIIQVIVSILLIIAILLQNRGAGTSGLFGGVGGNVYSTKRGIEKMLFYSTIVLSILFFAISLAIIII